MARRAAPRAACNRYPDRGATASCATALGAQPRPARRSGLRGERLQRGAPDAAPHLRRPRPARAGVRADLRAARPHRADHRHRGRRRRAAAPTSRIDPTPRRGASIERDGPTIVFVCSPNNPTGTVERRRARSTAARSTAAPGLLVVDEAYGEFAPGTRARPRRTKTGRSSWSARTRRCGRWPPLRLGYAVGPTWVVAGAREGRAPVPPRRGHPARRHASRSSYDAEMERPGRPPVAERERLLAAPRAVPGVDVLPVRRELPAVPASTGRRPAVWEGLVDRGCWSATSLLAAASRTASASRSARPRRTTRSSPRSGDGRCAGE